MHHLPLKADDQVKRSVERPFFQPTIAAGLKRLPIRNRGLRRACDATVSIPLSGRVESLNVSVAAALLLYEARRRRDG